MPKTYPKSLPKKGKTEPKKKSQAKPVSITSSKTYWLVLTLTLIVFGSVYSYIMKVAAAGIGFLLASVLFIIGFAYYLKFKPSPLKNSSRATFLFGGACTLGFGIWVAVILLSEVTGLWAQLAGSVGDYFFAITALIICMISGAFIGDLIGFNKEKIDLFFSRKFGN